MLIFKDGEYPLFDAIGSERTVTNSSQTVTGAINYDVFGNTVGTSGSSTDPYMFGATSRYRDDGDAGLILVGARYYDPAVGRFITRDTDLTQFAFVYCAGDPINAVDPSGHDNWLWDNIKDFFRDLATDAGLEGASGSAEHVSGVNGAPVIESPKTPPGWGTAAPTEGDPLEDVGGGYGVSTGILGAGTTIIQGSGALADGLSVIGPYKARILAAENGDPNVE